MEFGSAPYGRDFQPWEKKVYRINNQTRIPPSRGAYTTGTPIPQKEIQTQDPRQIRRVTFQKPKNATQDIPVPKIPGDWTSRLSFRGIHLPNINDLPLATLGGQRMNLPDISIPPWLKVRLRYLLPYLISLLISVPIVIYIVHYYIYHGIQKCVPNPVPHFWDRGVCIMDHLIYDCNFLTWIPSTMGLSFLIDTWKVWRWWVPPKIARWGTGKLMWMAWGVVWNVARGAGVPFFIKNKFFKKAIWKALDICYKRISDRSRGGISFEVGEVGWSLTWIIGCYVVYFIVKAVWNVVKMVWGFFSGEETEGALPVEKSQGGIKGSVPMRKGTTFRAPSESSSPGPSPGFIPTKRGTTRIYRNPKTGGRVYY